MAAGNRQSRIKALCFIKLGGNFALGILALVLSACQPQPEALLNDYQSRLQRVLEIPATELSKPALAPLPEIRTLSIVIPAATIDLTDMLALDICDLETLIAERNNSLGKVQTDASTLQYELKLLLKLGNCLKSPTLVNQLAPELQATLQQIYLQKQQQLPAVFANVLSRDPTLRQQLSGSQRGVAHNQSGLAESIQALQQLNRLRQLLHQQDYQAASQIRINSALGALHQSQLVADLQHSLRLAQQFFLILDQQLTQIPTTQLCQTDKTIRENLLTQIFIGRVQQELARLDGMATQLIAELQQLYQQHPLQQAIDQRLLQPQLGLQQQLRQHVAFWQRWRQCDERH